MQDQSDSNNSCQSLEKGESGISLDNDALFTIAEASRVYFQGKVSGGEITKLFHAGMIRGFRVGMGKKAKIILYKSGLDAYRLQNENRIPSCKEPSAALPSAKTSPCSDVRPRSRRRPYDPGPIRLTKLPD